jgi:hypothetical protein
MHVSKSWEEIFRHFGEHASKVDALSSCCSRLWEGTIALILRSLLPASAVSLKHQREHDFDHSSQSFAHSVVAHHISLNQHEDSSRIKLLSWSNCVTSVMLCICEISFSVDVVLHVILCAVPCTRT